MNVLLDAVGVQKHFAGVPALVDGRLSVASGEIHALMGANGAGKSTLLKILTGVYSRDAGTIHMADGSGELAEVSITGPREADRLGIAIVHQELILSENMSVADNLSLGAEHVRWGGLMLDSRATREYALRALANVGLDVDPSAMVSTLSTAEKQLVEIAKSLARDARVLILDEPTTSLTDNESRELFKVLRRLRDDGIGIVYVSHRMEEIFSLCDRITVMRDGSFIETVAVADTTRADLIRSMIGRTLAAEYDETVEPNALGGSALSVRNLSTPGFLQNIDIDVREGEIVGMFGLVGAGRTEVARAVFGLDKVTTGSVEVNGRRLRRLNPTRAIAAGMGLVPEDRKSAGLVLDMSIGNNLDLAVMRRWPAVRGSSSRSRRLWENYRDRLGIVAVGREQPVETLSGGNQQKVVLGKWLALSPTVLILDEPTRGVDVGAKDDLYTVIRELAEGGTGVLVISSEIEEILMISHRVIVMREGAITLDAPRRELDGHALLSAAMGEKA